LGAAFDVGLLDGLSRGPDTLPTARTLCSGPGGVPVSVAFVLSTIDEVIVALGPLSETEARVRGLRMAARFLRARPGPVALLSLDRLLDELESADAVAA